MAADPAPSSPSSEPGGRGTEPVDLRARRLDRQVAAEALAPLVAEALRSLTDEQLRELLRRRTERAARRDRDVKSG